MSGHRSRRKLFPLSIRTSIVVVVLVPLLIVVGLASTVVVHQTSAREQAVTAYGSSLTLDSLLRARVAIYDEYIPSQAIVSARSYGVSPAALDSLLGVDVQSELVDSRRSVDAQPMFGPMGSFRPEYLELVRLRRSIDLFTATPAQVEVSFGDISSKIDARWESTFDHLSDTSASSDSSITKDRLVALGQSFSAFTSGFGEENLEGGGSLEALLTTSETPAQVQSLVVSHQQFEESVASFPESLGQKGTEAWTSLSTSTTAQRFSGYVDTAIASGLSHSAPPSATTSAAISEIARTEVTWAQLLTNLVLASSSDLRTATTDQANSAGLALTITYILTLLLVLLAVGAALLLSRQLRSPLAGIVAAATSIREGELEIPELDESGPKELALAAAAFNEMVTTLHAVQVQTIALSEGDLDDPVLHRQLPGRTGAALQAALDQLRRSVRAGEVERDALLERATRDSLTGLLNRGAALEALELDMASVHRSNGELALTIFFIDLDGLKLINDSIGHEGGNAAIRAVANALKVTTRASDIIARFGGDEFIVGWLGNRESHAPDHLATRISAHVAQSTVGKDTRTVALGCSIGVAVSTGSDRSIEAVIERADRALYEAKANGRGQIRWC